MRRLLLIVLMLMVPLRALSADVMATWMLAQADTAAHAQQAQGPHDHRGHSAHTAVPVDCPMMKAAPAGTGEPGSEKPQAGQCHSCHFVMAAPSQPPQTPTPGTLARPNPRGASFASVVPMREHRPPIG